jgi:hypothetical protein
MRSDRFRFVHPLHLSLRLAELLHQRQRLAAETSAESTSLASAEEFNQFVSFQFEELLEVNAAVGELSERLLRLLGRVGDQGVFFGRVLFRSLFLMKSERVSLRCETKSSEEKKQAPKEGRRRREKCTKTARAKPRREHPFAARARDYRVKNHAPRDETVSPRFHPLQRLALRKRKFARSSVSFAARHIFFIRIAEKKKDARKQKKKPSRARTRIRPPLAGFARCVGFRAEFARGFMRFLSTHEHL